MVHFSETNQFHPVLNVAVHWQSSITEDCAKELSQILTNSIDNQEKGIGLRSYVRYCTIANFADIIKIPTIKLLKQS